MKAWPLTGGSVRAVGAAMNCPVPTNYRVATGLDPIPGPGVNPATLDRPKKQKQKKARDGGAWVSVGDPVYLHPPTWLNPDPQPTLAPSLKRPGQAAGGTRTSANAAGHRTRKRGKSRQARNQKNKAQDEQ